MTRPANPYLFDQLVAIVAENYDSIPGSRTEASRHMTYTPAYISHILTGRRRSWDGVKVLITWFRRQYPGVGNWDEAGLIMQTMFPDEPEWRKLRDAQVY